MAQRTPPVEGIRRLHLPEARRAIAPLHAYLRECILDGTLVPGTKLSQVALAEQLGISRTPLREVLRMLHEEGLVTIEPDQRTRVAGFDPAELDSVYAERVLVECLALSMTLEGFSDVDAARGRELLRAMGRASASGDVAAWFTDHTAFHRLLTSGAGEALQRRLEALAERSIRYIRIYQLSEPATWQVAGDREHAGILDALVGGDGPGAIAALAHHLSRTALRVMSDCRPDHVPLAVPRAVALVTGTPAGADGVLDPSAAACCA